MLDFRNHQPSTVEAACIALTNLAVESQNQFAIRIAQGIPALTAVLEATTSETLAGHAAACLANLFADDTARVEASRLSTSEALVRWLRQGGSWTHQKVASAVWGLAVGREGALSLKAAGAVQQLTALVLHSSENAQERAAGALWNLGRERAARGQGLPAASDAWRHLEVSQMLEKGGVSKEDAVAVRSIANRKVRESGRAQCFG